MLTDLGHVYSVISNDEELNQEYNNIFILSSGHGPGFLADSDNEISEKENSEFDTVCVS
jgi:hypothetical protein